MVDNAWRDSFVVKVKSRVAREEDHPISHDSHDNSSLLEIEKKANLVKPSGGGEDDPFAGTYFQSVAATGQAKLISKGLSITAQNSLNPEPVIVEEVIDPIANESPNKQRRGKSIYNRATQVLNEFAERLSSGGENGARRRSSKDEDLDRDKSTESSDRRKSAAPHRVKSVVSKLSRVSRRFVKQELEEESDETPDTAYSSTNPQFAGTKSIPEIPKSECDTISSGTKE